MQMRIPILLAFAATATASAVQGGNCEPGAQETSECHHYCFCAEDAVWDCSVVLCDKSTASSNASNTTANGTANSNTTTGEPNTAEPMTSVPEAPVPSTAVPTTAALPTSTPIIITFSFGTAAPNVSAESLANDAKTINAALTTIAGTDASSLAVIKICIGTDCAEISAADLAARRAQLLNADLAISVVVVVTPSGDAADLSVAEFTKRVVDAVKADIGKGGASLLKDSTPSSGSFAGLTAEAISGTGVLDSPQTSVPVTETNTPSQAPVKATSVPVTETNSKRDIAVEDDDDLSKGAIAGIVIGSIAFVALIGAAVFALGSGSAPAAQVANEPVEEPVEAEEGV